MIREVRRCLHYAPGVARGADAPAFAGIAVSYSGITQMGLDVARRVGRCAIGRATHKRFLCFSAPERLLWQPLGCAHRKRKTVALRGQWGIG